ncbi:hypothetical protein OSB04_011973 [Centaurea solstitialis]|uniref:CCHC-type domain-containing protein n=1 Tax=Centaurea solstitialis TaxID=347529 RepID=A0AA38WPM1_9ASTR|nr:hypothetical protein OSB04_011973 [Centaurea solstitialis]
MADQQPSTKTDLVEMTAAITTSLDNLTTAVTQVLAQLNNDPRQRRERHIEPIRVPLGGNRNRINQSSSESEEEEEEEPNNQRRNNHDYRMKADIPFFYGTMGVEDFLDWQSEVDRFFEIMEIPESKQIKMVAYRLKSTAAVWWDKLVLQRQRQRKGPVRSWRRMKQLMLERFLPEDYEQILYKMYLECNQGMRSVTDYTTEFLRLSERNEIGESEGQKVALVSGLRPTIQDKIGLQTMWTVAEASSLALKAELIEKSTRSSNSYRRSQETNESTIVALDKGKDPATSRDPNPTHKVTTGNSSGGPQGKTTPPKTTNPYAKPMGLKCYRCGEPGHRSNECTNRKTVGLVDGEEREDDDYDGAEFAEEDLSEKINIVLQRVLLSSKEDGQRTNLFRSHCSVNNKVCDLIVDNDSCENLVSQKLVDYLKLPTEPIDTPYSLGWIKRGPQVRVTQTCKVPISIGKHYKEDVVCDVLEMNSCHILLGRPWQYDNDVTYKGRDNTMLFRWGEHKIAMTPVLHFERDTKKKEKNCLVVAMNKHPRKEDALITKKVTMCNKPEPVKHGPFVVITPCGFQKGSNKTQSCGENSGSSSLKVEETDTGRVVSKKQSKIKTDYATVGSNSIWMQNSIFDHEVLFPIKSKLKSSQRGSSTTMWRTKSKVCLLTPPLYRYHVVGLIYDHMYDCTGSGQYKSRKMSMSDQNE